MNFTEKQMEIGDKLHDEFADRQLEERREKIESVSRLLQACKLCGATFRTGLKTEITMPDNRTYRVDERITCWRLSHRGFARTFKKAHTAEKLKDQILEFHVRISQEKACPRFLHS